MWGEDETYFIPQEWKSLGTCTPANCAHECYKAAPRPLPCIYRFSATFASTLLLLPNPISLCCDITTLFWRQTGPVQDCFAFKARSFILRPHIIKIWHLASFSLIFTQDIFPIKNYLPFCPWWPTLWSALPSFLVIFAPPPLPCSLGDCLVCLMIAPVLETNIKIWWE